MAYIGRQPTIGVLTKVDSLLSLQNNTRAIFPLTITNQLSSHSLIPVTPLSLLVVKNGEPLEPGVDYTVDQDNINFGEYPLLTTDDIWISTFGEPIDIGEPADGAIEDSNFAAGSVTNAKLTQSAQDTIISNIVSFGV
jgi:hypothetical protein